MFFLHQHLVEMSDYLNALLVLPAISNRLPFDAGQIVFIAIVVLSLETLGMLLLSLVIAERMRQTLWTVTRGRYLVTFNLRSITIRDQFRFAFALFDKTAI